jgi:hypothetical protein
MKYLMIPLLALTFIAGFQNLEATCERPPQGPAGNFLANYITSYLDTSTTAQSLPGGVPELVEFPFNLTGPVGITHPNSTDFVVQNAGVYYISWTVNAQSNDCAAGATDPAIIHTTLNVNGFPLNPTAAAETFELISPPPDTCLPLYTASLSGSLTLLLFPGDTLNLGTVAFFDAGTEPANFMEIFSDLFTITQIALLPPI